MRLYNASIFLIVVVIFSSLILANVLCQEPECSSDDPPDAPVYPEGNDHFQAGKTTYQGKEYPDQCIVSSNDKTYTDLSITLEEYYCPTADDYASMIVNCGDYGEEFICFEGACIQATCYSTDLPKPPIYPQGDHNEAKGEISGEYVDDHCIVSPDNPAVWTYSGTLKEYYCPGPFDSYEYRIIDCVEYGIQKYEEYYICDNGACVKPACYSTDPLPPSNYPQGNDSFIPGKTTYSENTPEEYYEGYDNCLDDIILLEAYCDRPNLVLFAGFDCNQECIDKKPGAISGRCIQTDKGGYCLCLKNKCDATDPPNCEIDGVESYPCGFDPFTRGDATGSGDPSVDVCKDADENPSERYLTEYYCPTEPETEYWDYEHKIIDCHDWYNTICSDGACVCTLDMKVDIDGNRKVNIVDITFVAKCFGYSENEQSWVDNNCERCNFDKDRKDENNHQTINILDISIIAKAFGNNCDCKEGTYNPSTGECE